MNRGLRLVLIGYAVSFAGGMVIGDGLKILLAAKPSRDDVAPPCVHVCGHLDEPGGASAGESGDGPRDASGES